jgi:hypothetical protein
MLKLLADLKKQITGLLNIVLMILVAALVLDVILE